MTLSKHEIEKQLDECLHLLKNILREDLLGVYLYGSAIVGGLQKYSDIDLLVVTNRSTTHEEKAELAANLLQISGIYMQSSKPPIEMTIVNKTAVNPWHYPPDFDFQYGEWLRKEFESGHIEPWSTKEMPDLALLITQVLLASKILQGPHPNQLLENIPYRDFMLATAKTLDGLMAELDSDTRNVLLTYARIWSTVETDTIRSKPAAADWVIERLPENYRPVINRAKEICIGESDEYWDDIQSLIQPCVNFILTHINKKISSVALSDQTNQSIKLMSTTKMHDNELEMTEYLVRNLIHQQCPHWIYLPLTPVKSSGTDHALFRLGDNYVVRLPRIEWTPGSVEKGVNKEFTWLPQLARYLPVPISEPVFKGEPDQNYPFPWLVSKWHEGQSAHFENEDEYETLAGDLARFLNALHAIPLANGPQSRRGIPLTTSTLDQETRKAINELHDDINVPIVLDLWNQLSTQPVWNQPLVWVHGDFLPGNILVKDYRLSEVIDFSDVGVGDPACDLVIAWSLFNTRSRKIFRDQLENIDEATWERGRGWALSIALIMLPYYKHNNPMLAKTARRMIKMVLDT